MTKMATLMLNAMFQNCQTSLRVPGGWDAEEKGGG